MAADASRVRLDLNSPEFQAIFFRLEAAELKQVVASLRRLSELDWAAIYRHTGFQWEAIKHFRAPNGAGVYSLRLSQKVRALAFRDGHFLRFLSLHPDHDSAYRR
ncbi:MAG: hypothetical protein ABI584_10300 [Acidobacteriota bacterium]